VSAPARAAAKGAKSKPKATSPDKGAKPKTTSPDKGAKPKSTSPARPDKDEGSRIVHAEFIAAAAPGSELPAPTSAEVAFAGRSNVGKSSLINVLVERKSLVRTSSTPGSTRQINLFEARARDGTTFRLADLPGYGFTRRSKGETSAWQALVEGYLRGRATLAAVVILCDARRGLEEDDIELIDFIQSTSDVSRRPVEVLIVATKLDKIARSSQRLSLDKLRKSTGRRVIGFSSVTAEGRAALWTEIRRVALGIPARDQDAGEPAAPEG
jgi:GTP-binding protein